MTYEAALCGDHRRVMRGHLLRGVSGLLRRLAMTRLGLAALCAASVYAMGCLTGGWLVRSDVEAAARVTIAHFSDEVSVLAGRIATLEAVCR